MSNERKMLEAAALACGYSVRTDLTYNEGIVIEDGFIWNPLTSSADCAAMCAKLEISTNWYSVDGIGESVLWSVRCSLGPFQTYEAQMKDHNNDPEVAWRYAATRVAAKIGGMK